jgi:G3E family GTPase
MQNKISVYIITGFLGSGKTTILNDLLRQFANEKNMVIENEFGKINIDATLVNGSFERVYELTNGCICCSINNQLLHTLSEIDGLEQKPKNLFLETTGIADAGEVAVTFKNLYIEKKFDLKKIICVVDAENSTYYSHSNIEIYRQIVAADCVLINKTSPVADHDLEEMKQWIRSINAYAAIVISEKGSIDKKILFTENSQKITVDDTQFSTKNEHKIKTLLFETDTDFDIQKLKYELFKSLYLYYHQIFRIKGYVLNENKEVFLVQSVGKTSTVVPVNGINIEKSQLVFIGKELELKSIERILKRAFVKLPRVKAQKVLAK